MFSHESWSCEVFWCAAEGYFALLMLFKEVSIVGAKLIRPGSFSGYQQKAPSSLEHWHFHLLQREEVSPEVKPRQKYMEEQGEYLERFPKSSRFTIVLRKMN
jgi:hypothetical protein